MANYTVNSCKRIVLGGSSPTDIKEVWYCDNYGVSHLIWPCRAELTDVYLVDLTTDTSYPYSYSNNEPSPRLIPYHDYAIKGTIKVYEATGDLEATLTDCYFFHETFSTVVSDTDPDSSNWSAPDNSSAGYPDRYPKVDGVPMDSGHGFQVYTINDNSLGNIQRRSVQLGFYNDDSYGFYTQNGFVFDHNYQTPIELKRIEISEEAALFDADGNTMNPSGITFPENGSVTVFPKLRRVGDGYQTNYLTSTSWTYPTDKNWCTITNNNDGSYTITSNGVVPDNTQLSFISVNGTTMNLYMIWQQQYDYRYYIGSDWQSNSSTITNATSVTVRRDEYGGDFSNPTYVNDFTISCDNSSLVNIDNSTHTVTPIANGTTTLRILMNGTEVYSRSITTVAITSLYGRVLINGDQNQPLTIGNSTVFTLGRNNNLTNLSLSNANQLYVFEFYSSYNSVAGLTNPVNVTIPNSITKPNTTEINSANNTITFVWTTSGTTGNYSFDVLVNGNTIGTISGSWVNS